jgi:hypothetical protein
MVIDFGVFTVPFPITYRLVHHPFGRECVRKCRTGGCLRPSLRLTDDSSSGLAASVNESATFTLCTPTILWALSEGTITVTPVTEARNTHTHTNIHTHICTHTHTHPHTHTHTHTHIHTSTHTHIHSHVHTHTHTHTHTLTYTHTQTHMHTYMHTHTHAHIRTYGRIVFRPGG